jgi:hypothetical protein
MSDNLGRGATEDMIEKYWSDSDEILHNMCGSWMCDDDCNNCAVYLDEEEENP